MPACFRSRLLPEVVQYRIGYYTRALDAAVYIRERLADELHLSAIAGAAGMTPNAFSRYFAAKIGITVASLIRTLRIERALEQMEAGDCVVARLAGTAGYQSHSTFSRAFKDVTGHSPTEYRRRILIGTPASEAS